MYPIMISDKSNALRNISTLQAMRRRADRGLFPALFAILLVLTPLMVLGGAVFGFGVVVAMGVVAVIVTLTFRWPIIGLFVLTGCAVIIDQDTLSINGVTLLNLYVFHWPSNLTGLPERPIGLFMLITLGVLLLHRFGLRQRILQGGGLFWSFCLFLLCIIVGIVHGLTSGGDAKITVLEVRSLWYLFLSYLLAYNLIKSKQDVRILFWILIFGTGLKGLMGTYIYFGILQGNLQGYHEIMAHEESFFFVALLLLIILFSIHYNYRPQLYAALLVSPFVLIALIANQRRTDYVALLITVFVVWAFVCATKPRVRKKLIISMIICMLLIAGYIGLFYRVNGVIGEPARAFVSVFYADPSDTITYNSNLYRIIENVDLKFTVKQNLLIGWGFGKPFLQPAPLPNILILDPYYLYIPHNSIYWIWMRLGALGYFALWFLFGSIIVRGGIIARQLKDHYFQSIAIFILGMVFIEIIAAYSDHQLFFYRNVIYVGLLTGLLMKLPLLDESEKVSLP